MAWMVLAVACSVVAADPKTPNVVELYNSINNDHPIKKAAGGWMIDGKVPVTVDLPNGYLTFDDPHTKKSIAAALWKSDGGVYLGITGVGVMSYWVWADPRVNLQYELPRKGTTLVAHVDLGDIRADIRDAKLADSVENKLLAIVDKQTYTRIELPFRKSNGGFDVGKMSR
jgi:hypothetical protein